MTSKYIEHVLHYGTCSVIRKMNILEEEEKKLPITLKIGLSFQKWIQNITEENFDEFSNQIITTFISVFADENRIENLTFICNEICFSCENEQNKIPIFAKLIHKIQSSKIGEKAFDGFLQLIKDVILSTQSIIPFEKRVRLLRECFDQKIFSLDEICEILVNFPVDSSPRLFILLCMFGPEVDEHFNSLFNSTFNKYEVYLISIQQISENGETSLSSFENYKKMLDSYRGVESNSWVIGREIIKDKYPHDSLEYAISKDNLELLKTKEIPSEIRLKISYLNPLSENLSPLQFAALYNAQKCFKFLIDKEGENEQKLEQIPIFAIEGNSKEILDFCLSKNCDINGTLIPSVLYRRNTILQYLLSSYKEKFSENEIKSALSLCMRTKNIEAILLFNHFVSNKK